MPTAPSLETGQRVRLRVGPMGTLREDEPYRFTPHVAAAGATGTVVTGPVDVPDGWVLVKLDEPASDGASLYCPVHPISLAPEEG